MSYLTCELTENTKVIKLITKETCTEPGELLVSLEIFRQTVNETFTSMIENIGENINEIDDYVNEDEESNNDESLTLAVIPKKRKK